MIIYRFIASESSFGRILGQRFQLMSLCQHHFSIAQVVNTNQFSVTKHKRVVRQVTGEHGLPGVFVLYEFSPMVVQYTENRRSFMHFLTGLCAIVGGIFTVAGLIDSMIYHSSRALQKKIDLGKAT